MLKILKFLKCKIRWLAVPAAETLLDALLQIILTLEPIRWKNLLLTAEIKLKNDQNVLRAEKKTLQLIINSSQLGRNEKLSNYWQTNL